MAIGVPHRGGMYSSGSATGGGSGVVVVVVVVAAVVGLNGGVGEGVGMGFAGASDLFLRLTAGVCTTKPEGRV